MLNRTTAVPASVPTAPMHNKAKPTPGAPDTGSPVTAVHAETGNPRVEPESKLGVDRC
jgi:hypothetical protein